MTRLTSSEARADPPIPPRVRREMERILDEVAKRLFLERLDREALAERAALRQRPPERP